MPSLHHHKPGLFKQSRGSLLSFLTPPLFDPKALDLGQEEALPLEVHLSP